MKRDGRGEEFRVDYKEPAARGTEITVTAADVAGELGCTESALMKSLALIGWNVLMSESTRAAHGEYFASLRTIPEMERQSFQGPRMGHVITTARDMFPSLIGHRPKKVGTRRHGYIYVLYDAQTKLCKIGRTQTEGTRQRTQMSAHGGILANVLNAEVADCVAAEQQCHEHFHAHRKNGEWFDVELTEVITYINENVEAMKLDFENLARLVQYIAASEQGDLARARAALSR